MVPNFRMTFTGRAFVHPRRCVGVGRVWSPECVAVHVVTCGAKIVAVNMLLRIYVQGLVKVGALS